MTRRGFLGAPAMAFAIQGGKLRAGAARANITPPLGTPINGSFTEGRSADNHDELWVRALALEDGNTRIAIALVDTCVNAPSVVREAKRRIAQESSITESHALVCATHTHSAGATMAIFQTSADPSYGTFVANRIADAVRIAVGRMQPARVGFGFGREDRLIFNRRYHMKPEAALDNPFGGQDRVKTNPGIGNPLVIKPAGPIDPVVGVLIVEAADGTRIATLGNYSLHYVGGVPGGHISADYFGVWARQMGDDAAIAMLTNGAQGDVNNVDVLGGSPTKLAPYQKMNEVARVLADECRRITRDIRFTENAPISAGLEWLDLGTRLPSQSDIASAKKVLAKVDASKQYREMPIVFARETLALASYPKAERVPVQALRIGDLAIAALPGEPFVELGLEVRRRSRFRQMFIVGLSNEHVGYVPTVEAHALGGYETWRARTSYLEIDAAPKITTAMLRRLQSL